MTRPWQQPRTKTCRCGSGLPREQLLDARGIFCDYVCAECVDQVKKKFRPEIFTDSQYETDEQIEEEPGVGPRETWAFDADQSA